MFERNTLLGLTAAAVIGTAAVRCPAATPAGGVRPPAVRLNDDKDDDKKVDEKTTEEKVAVGQLPPAVVATVMGECPGGKITAAEKVIRNGKLTYVMDVTVRDKKFVVKTKENGGFKSKKAAKAEAGDEKK